MRHYGHREDLEMCVMYRRFLSQAERILGVHGNHESTGYFKGVVTDAQEKYKEHRDKAEAKERKSTEVHPQV